MSGGKETPRQKMIGMMYLVLTALLALNVSKQIIQSFVVVNTGLQKTNQNAVDENLTTYKHFEKAMANDKVKTKKYYDKAMEAKKLSEDMVNYIQDLKASLVMKVDQKKMDSKDTMLEHVDAKDDFTTPTGILVGQREDGADGQARKLEDKIVEYRKSIKSLLLSPKDSTQVNIGLLTQGGVEDGEKLNWVVFNFAEAPLVADVVTLTKLQNDVRNAESSVINYLYNQIDASSFKVSDFVAEVIPSSSYVMLGDSFRAQVFPSAFSSTQKPVIEIDTVNGQAVQNNKVPVDFTGIGRYAIKTDKEGPETFAGVIKMKAPDGSMKSYPFRSSYIVAKAAVVISPTEMNVFYAGIDNPVDITVPGIADENAIHPSINVPASMSGSHGHYKINPSAAAIGKEASIIVTATMPDGSHKTMPPQKFRIKRIPDPSCYTGGRTGDIAMSRLQLQAVPKVEARMPSDFEFAGVKFNVISFDMSIGVNGVFVDKHANGGYFTPDMKQLIGQAPKGGYIIVKDVQVKGPDGKTRTISGMAIRIN